MKNRTRKLNKVQNAYKFVTVWGNIELTRKEKSVLNKGLKFINQTKDIPIQSIFDGFNAFARRMRLKWLFSNRPITTVHTTKFRNKSNFLPPKSNPSLEHYLEKTKMHLIKEIKKIKGTPPTIRRNNVAFERVLNELAKNKEIIIKKQDKGSGIVAIERKLYIEKGLEFLENADYFEEIQNDDSINAARKISQFLSTTKEIKPDIKKYLDPIENDQTRLADLYFLPKMHKNPPKLRPICSANGTPTERIGQFLDFFLQPIVERQTTYLKDTTAVINKLENQKFPEEARIITLDVTSLYTNISHEAAIKQVREALFKNPQISYALNKPSIEVLTKITELIVDNNMFSFDKKIYKQKIGLAMGNVAAPAISDIVLHEIEKLIIAQIGEKCLFYGRYRDDILCISTVSNKDFEEILDYANNISERIKFEGKIDESADFLDLIIYKGERFVQSGIFDLRIKEKPFGVNSYLHYQSNHPPNVFGALVKGELIRSVRNNSSIEAHNKRKTNFFKILKERDYPRQLLNKTSYSVDFSNRRTHLKYQNRKKSEVFPMIVEWYPGFLNLRKCLRVNWNEIQENDELSKVFTTKPTLTFKRGKNIADKLISAKVPPKT